MAAALTVRCCLGTLPPRRLSTSSRKPIQVMGNPSTFVSAPDRRIVAVGDLHGDLAQTRRALEIAGVLSSDGRDLWTGKETVLIQVGDILDRGEDEIAILSLLHSLSIQAEANGGAVFQVHGNHETMNVEGDFRYVDHGAFEECIDFLEYLNEHDGNWDEALVGWVNVSERLKEERRMSKSNWDPWKLVKIDYLQPKVWKSFFFTNAQHMQYPWTLFSCCMSKGLWFIFLDAISCAPQWMENAHFYSRLEVQCTGRQHAVWDLGMWNYGPHVILKSTDPLIRGQKQRGVLARSSLLGPGGLLACELARHAVVLKVDDWVFCHGGLLPHHVAYGIERMNREVSNWMRGFNENNERPKIPFIATRGYDSVVWNRLYSRDSNDMDYRSHQICSILEETLEAVGAKGMVVGHTPQTEGVNCKCNHRIWRIDVGMSSGVLNSRPEVLEIVDNEARAIRKGKDAFSEFDVLDYT